MASLERFQKLGTQKPESEYKVYPDYAFVSVDSPNGRLFNFSPLQHGTRGNAQLIGENEVLLPPGAVAGANIDDEMEILFKHFKKKGRHDIGLVVVVIGGQIEHKTDNDKDYYFMEGTATLKFPALYHVEHFGELSVTTRFVK